MEDTVAYLPVLRGQSTRDLPKGQTNQSTDSEGTWTNMSLHIGILYYILGVQEGMNVKQQPSRYARSVHYLQTPV